MEAKWEVQFQGVSGLVFGLEHLTEDDDPLYPEINYLIVLHLGFFRITLINFKE